MIILNANTNGLELTDEEKAAKNFFLRNFIEADELHVDEDINDLEPYLASWYDDAKFKRGQQYFANNRAAIVISNMIGLISLLTNYKGVQILSGTGRSSTAETAKRRYASTVLHTISWYEHELVPGSESWKSLSQVRRMHYGASKLSERKNIGFISQNEMAATQFGFMGFALIRPQIFGIKHNNEEDIEGFLHFWAVIGHMLGIKDDYNICLQPVKIVRIICQAILRYLVAPGLQLETPQFKVMTKALLDGMNEFVPQISYEYQVFMARRAACVPGYQHNVDRDGEALCCSIFSENEIEQFLKLRQGPREAYLEFLFFSKIPVYHINKNKMMKEINANSVNDKAVISEDIIVENGECRLMEPKFRMKLRNFLDLDESTTITLTLIDYETEWKSSLNDSKFLELNSKDQSALLFRAKLRKFVDTRIGRFIMNWFVSLLMWRLRRFLTKPSNGRGKGK